MKRDRTGRTTARPGTVTDDGHHIVVGGRRWRATDPSIPEKLAAELRTALMAARRDVGSAKRNGNDERASRAAVHDAKIALGERGEPWWEPTTEEFRRERIGAAIRTLVEARSPRTACPSDVARVVGGMSWRSLMPIVRDVAVQLSDDGELVVTQGGRPVQAPWRGPVRLAKAGPVTGSD